MDMLWPGYLAVEHKSAGNSLSKAMDQALDYLPDLPQAQLPRLVVVANFTALRVRDLETNHEHEFLLEELPQHLGQFEFLAGYRPRAEKQNEEAVNLDATQLLADLHDLLLASNYTGHPLRVLLTRILFILFADDTGVWERGLFHDLVTVPHLRGRARSRRADLDAFSDTEHGPNPAAGIDRRIRRVYLR